MQCFLTFLELVRSSFFFFRRVYLAAAGTGSAPPPMVLLLCLGPDEKGHCQCGVSRTASLLWSLVLQHIHLWEFTLLFENLGFLYKMFYLSKEQCTGILNTDRKHLCERVCTCKRVYVVLRPTTFPCRKCCTTSLEFYRKI